MTIALARLRPHFAGQAIAAKAAEQIQVVASVLIFLIRIYQRTLSRLLGNVCRFEPSCSRYAVACLENHGALRGSLLSVVRLCKCHPFHPGGIDLPPPKKMSS